MRAFDVDGNVIPTPARKPFAAGKIFGLTISGIATGADLVLSNRVLTLTFTP